MTTPRERFLTALTGGIPDRTPIGDYLFSLPLMQQELGFTTPLYDGPTQVRLAKKLGLDVIWAPANGFCGIEEVEHKKGEKYQDEWQVSYEKEGWPIIAQIDTPIKTRADWDKYVMPDSGATHRLKILSETIKANKEADLAIMFGLLGPLTMLSWYFMDMATFSFALYDDREMVKDMCRKYIDWALEVGKKAIAAGGVDVFSISDDWGSTASLLISPEHYRSIIIPEITRLHKGLAAMGKPVIMHNDGRIWELLDDIVATGISGLHPIERAAGGDLGFVKNKYAGRLCPIGNVNNKGVMTYGTPQEVKQEVLECLHIGMPGGGYIIATDHSIHGSMPYENVMTYLETVHEYGKY